MRQESTGCCGMTIDHIAGAMNENFREIKIGEKIVNFLEPICPEYGRRVKAVYSVMQ